MHNPMFVEYFSIFKRVRPKGTNFFRLNSFYLLWLNMLEKFNGIFYLILFIIHFVGFGVYAYQMIIGNQKFRAKFEIDETAATIMRMTGAIFLG